MFGRAFTIALNTYRESVRARILIGLAGVAFAVSLYSLVVGSFTLKSAPRVVTDLGAASISLFSIAVAIIIGATSLHRELEQKTIFPILARPIARAEYLVGKYMGTLLTIGVFIMADTALVLHLAAGLAGRSPVVVVGSLLVAAGALGAMMIVGKKVGTFGPIVWAVVFLGVSIVVSRVAPTEQRMLLGASLLTFLEVCIVAAVATLFSSFSTPFLSALFTLGFFLIGRSADTLAKLPKKQFGEQIVLVGKGMARVFPNLQVYVPPRTLLTGEAVDVDPSAYYLRAVIMALAWALGLLALASVIFKRRDFL